MEGEVMTTAKAKAKAKADPWAGYRRRETLMEALRKHLEIDHQVLPDLPQSDLMTTGPRVQQVWAEWLTIHASLPHQYRGEPIDAFMAANGPDHPYAVPRVNPVCGIYTNPGRCVMKSGHSGSHGQVGLR
jgi:hypothetical protein